MWPFCTEASMSSPTGNAQSMMTYPAQCVTWTALHPFWWYRQSPHAHLVGACSTMGFWFLIMQQLEITTGRRLTMFVYTMMLNIWLKELEGTTITAISYVRCELCVVLSRVLRIKMASTSLALFVLYSQVKPLETSDFTALKDLLNDFFFFLFKNAKQKSLFFSLNFILLFILHMYVF